MKISVNQAPMNLMNPKMTTTRMTKITNPIAMTATRRITSTTTSTTSRPFSSLFR